LCCLRAKRTFLEDTESGFLCKKQKSAGETPTHPASSRFGNQASKKNAWVGEKKLRAALRYRKTYLMGLWCARAMSFAL
jgi:hypothetical protein